MDNSDLFILFVFGAIIFVALLMEWRKNSKQESERKMQKRTCENCHCYSLEFNRYKKTAPYCGAMNKFLKDNEACSEWTDPELFKGTSWDF